MKKISYPILLACAGLFFSCSNEEIDIVSTSTYLSVNTAKVMKFDGMDYLATKSSFFSQDIVSELKTLPSDGRLRVRSLIYDKSGQLVQDISTMARNYVNKIDNKMMVPNGTYTVVTITDVVGVDDDENISLRFWMLKDSTNLNTAKIERSDYIGGNYMVLSATVNTVEVSEERDRTYNVEPVPIGSLFFIVYDNIHSNSAIEKIGLEKRKNAQSVTFTSSGSRNNFQLSNDYDWWLANLEPADYPNSTSIYDTQFELATTDYSLEWIYNNGSWWYFGRKTMDLNAGELYYAYCDMSTIGNSYISQYIIPANEFRKSSAPAKPQEVKAIHADRKLGGGTKEVMLKNIPALRLAK